MGAGLPLLPSARFRFTEPDDVATYGGEWTEYDEAKLVRIPARELIAIENTIGMSIVTMIQRDRREFSDAKLAILWAARRLAGKDDDWDTFSPLVLLVEWDFPERAPAADADPPDPGSLSSPDSTVE